MAAEFGCRWTADYREAVADPAIAAVSVCVPPTSIFRRDGSPAAPQACSLRETLTSRLEEARLLLDKADQTPLSRRWDS